MVLPTYWLGLVANSLRQSGFALALLEKEAVMCGWLSLAACG